MGNVKFTYFLIIIIALILLSGCDVMYADIEIINKSSKDIYVYSCYNQNKEWLKFNSLFSINEIKDTIWSNEIIVKDSYEYLQTMAPIKKSINELSPQGKIFIYIFDPDLIKRYFKYNDIPKDSTFQMFSYSIIDLEKMKWIVNYNGKHK
jgi:hypothetical protein